MPTGLSVRQIWIEVDWKTFYTDLVDAITALQPRLPRGNNCTVHVLIKNNGTVIDTFTGITSVIMEIHANRESSSGALVEKTVLAAALTACDQATFNARTGQHALFTLSSTDTNFDLTGQAQGEKDFWLVFHAVLTGPTYNTLGGCKLKVWEDSAQLGLPVIGTSNPNWAVGTNQQLYIKNISTGEWHKVWIEGTTSAPVLKLGPGETA